MVKKGSKEPVVPVDRGNIDVSRRPIVQTAEGSATIYSMSFSDRGKEVLIPKVAVTENGQGRMMSQHEAVVHYFNTGEHLGKFKNGADADKYGVWLHNEEQKRLNKRDMKDTRR
jgi:hypothetical protein